MTLNNFLLTPGMVVFYLLGRSTDTSEHMLGRGVLLETPTGFAAFIVKKPLEAEVLAVHTAFDGLWIPFFFSRLFNSLIL